MTDSMVPEREVHLFVYGTLRRGGRNHALLSQAPGVEYVGGGWIQGRLYDLGSFPGVVEGREAVSGEVYRLSDPVQILPRLDSLEGYSPDDPEGSLFLRRQVQATLPGGGKVWVWVYFYNREVSTARWISSGVYGAKRRPGH